MKLYRLSQELKGLQIVSIEEGEQVGVVRRLHHRPGTEINIVHGDQGRKVVHRGQDDSVLADKEHRRFLHHTRTVHRLCRWEKCRIRRRCSKRVCVFVAPRLSPRTAKLIGEIKEYSILSKTGRILDCSCEATPNSNRLTEM